MLSKIIPYEVSFCLFIFQKRGLDDITQFQDYPYRNDGRIIWDEIETFAREFVHM